MAVTYTANLVIYTGTDFDQTFALEDDQSNSALNLTGYSGCAQLKRYESSSKTADFTVSFANERDTRRVTISLGSTESAQSNQENIFTTYY